MASHPELVFYSGGYITRSRVIFIILMLLHEIIHIIEYTDEVLSRAKYSHIIFFYIHGFRVFGLISRLSNIIKKRDLKEELLRVRLDNLKAISAITDPNELVEDGAYILNDHSHYETGKKRKRTSLIGYIPINQTLLEDGPPLIGGKSKYCKKYTRKNLKKYTRKNLKKYNKSKYKNRRSNK